MNSDTIWLFLLLPAGFVAGVVNVLAGGGSFLTLPVLIAAGLPVHIANGTNRLSVVAQGLFVTRDYQTKGAFDAALFKKLLVPLVPGAILGAYLATVVDPRSLENVFGVLFLATAAIVFMRARKGAQTSLREHPLRYPALVLVGVYGGFIQAGVGLWILVTSTALFGVDALRANTVKLPLTLTFTVPALAIFLQADMVAWLPGIILAVGTVLGSLVGVRLSMKGGEALILQAVTVVLLLTGVHLLWP